jgi:hypothetical protein
MSAVACDQRKQDRVFQDIRAATQSGQYMMRTDMRSGEVND